jgi:hypothetical protein
LLTQLSDFKILTLVLQLRNDNLHVLEFTRSVISLAR